MEDFVGKELKIGDKIVYVRNCKRFRDFGMIKTEVIGFTDKMVKVPQLNFLNDTKYSCISPSNCIIY